MKRAFLLLTCAFVVFALSLPSCKHDLLYNTPLTPIDTSHHNPIDTVHVPVDTLHCDTCAAGVVSFTEDILPILQTNCAKSGCHDSITHKEHINTSSYTSLMNTTDAGRGLGSDFWQSINGGGENAMPPYPNQPLTAAQLSLIRNWILQGTQNTTCSHHCGCDSTNVTFSATINPIIQTYCLGCHTTGSTQGGVDLTGYNNIKTQVTNGQLMKSIKHDPSVVGMPYNATKLNDCTIAKLQHWVNAGAPNN